MDQKEKFTEDAESAEKMASILINQGILQRKKAHAKTLKARQDKIKSAATD